MFRVLSGRLAGLPAVLRTAAMAAGLTLPLAIAGGVLSPATEAWARIGGDAVDSDAPSPFATPDPAGHGSEDEPLPEGALEPPPLPGETPADGSQPVTSQPDTSQPGTSQPDTSQPGAGQTGPAPSDEPSPTGPDERAPVDASPTDASPLDASPTDAGPTDDAPASADPGEEPPTPFGVDPNRGVRPPAADVPADTSPLPEVHYGEEGLPEPVRKTRAAILEAARSGDIEALRAVLETSEMPPVLARGDVGDPIIFLKESSGDPEGREILAILIDLLEAGWVRLDPGEPGEMYVWPYFAAIPIDRLSPQQLVELYRILTAADVDEMRAYDAWLFFKIGIGADGSWHYFMVDEP